MPTTRLARRLAAAQRLLELPADVLGLVLYQLTLAHDIAAVAPTCHALCDAAKLARKLRPFSAEVVTLPHIDELNCVAAAPDGRIITGTDEGNFFMWRADEEQPFMLSHRGHDDHIMAVAVLPGGASFVTASYDNTVKLWTLDVPNTELYCDFECTFENHCAWCLAALPDGVHFLVGVGANIRLYHVDGTLVHIFTGHDVGVHALAVTRDGQHIISGANDKLVKVWSVATKSLVSTCVGHDVNDGLVYAVAEMPDGQRILSGSADGEVRVWLLDGTLKNAFTLHKRMMRGYVWAVNALLPLPDNKHALSASNDYSVKLFNANDGAVLRTFKHHTNKVSSLALMPDGIRFVSASYDGTARIVEHGLAPQ